MQCSKICCGSGKLSAGFAIVVDLGKTLSKVTLWSRDGRLLDRRVRANEVAVEAGIRRLDAAATASWLVEALAAFAAHPVEYVIPVAHGAALAAVRNDALAFAPFDYEQEPPQDVLAAYRRERDGFALTGSPPLPAGLNLAAQLFWLERIAPEALEGAQLMPWAQYWAWFLSGTAASEVTSLGCHTDLWCPAEARFSPLATRMGWDRYFAPIANAGDVLGTIRPELAAETGLPASVKVLAGLHDSNAALLAARGFAEIAGREATVLSTGTWFVAMRTPGAGFDMAALREGRDCLVNVDAFGQAIPSARFMGGREIESVIEIDTRRVDIKPDQPALLAAVPAAIGQCRMLLPTLAAGCGPFPHGEARWINPPEDWYERRAAMCLYAALVADASLDLIGARQCLLVEGRFAEAEVFVRALAALRPDMAVYTANAHNDVSFGAMRLIDPSLKPQGELRLVEPLDADLDTYRSRWQAECTVAA